MRQRFWFMLIATCGLLGLNQALFATTTLKAVTLNYPPFGSETQEGCVGVSCELIEEALKRSGKKLKVSFVPWKRALAEVRLGNADMVFNAAQTPERLRYAHFPVEVLENEMSVFFVRKDSNIKIDPKFQNVKHLRLGIQDGFFYGKNLNRAIERHKFKQVTAVNDLGTNVKKLMNKRIDTFAGNYFTTMHYLQENDLVSHFDIVTDQQGQFVVAGKTKTYVAFSKKTVPYPIVEQVGEALRVMKLDGTYQKIINKYL